MPSINKAPASPRSRSAASNREPESFRTAPADRSRARHLRRNAFQASVRPRLAAMLSLWTCILIRAKRLRTNRALQGITLVHRHLTRRPARAGIKIFIRRSRPRHCLSNSVNASRQTDDLIAALLRGTTINCKVEYGASNRRRNPKTAYVEVPHRSRTHIQNVANIPRRGTIGSICRNDCK
jgi:hypothetical protein